MQHAIQLKELLLRTRKTIFYAAAFSCALNILMLLLPLYSLQVLDRVVSSRSVETLFMLTLITVIGFIFYGIFSALRTSLLNGVTQWLDNKLAPHLIEQSIIRSSMGVASQAGSYLRDLATIKTFISGGMLTTMLDIPWSMIFIFVIYMVSPVLGFITVGGIVVMLVFALINEYCTRVPVKQSIAHFARSQNFADMACRNAEAIESMGMMGNVVNLWKKTYEAGSEAQMKGAGRANIIQSVTRIVRMLVQIMITGVGAFLVLQHEMSVGGMIAGSILVGRAMGPFENAIGLWRQWISTRDGYARLQEAMQQGQSLERGTLPLPAPEGRVSVEALIFTPPKSAPILKGVNFSMEPGEAIGIIGPSAAGKSTLAKLIIGLLPPTHGTVRLDGMETFKWYRANFGQYVGYLPQNVDLFPGTIKDNIARMDQNASMDAVVEAARRAHVHDMILRLPGGYETECGVGNLGLSPGQRQRIGLARALYGNPRFVVLDEPNLNLDGDGERALIEALVELKRSRISFIVVAHRPTIVSVVDKLIVMKGGLIERYGPREDILRAYTAPQTPAAADGSPQQNVKASA